VTVGNSFHLAKRFGAPNRRGFSDRKDLARRIFLLAETVATVKATDDARIQSLPNAPKIMRNDQELSE